MDLFEYQARELFDAHDVPVLPATVAGTPDEAEDAAAGIGGVTVVKAQVRTGGRGKAGGIAVAESPEKAREAAARILDLEIKGHPVDKVMVTQGADIAEEYYFSLLIDRAERSYLTMFSAEGGVDIEQLAAERPDDLVRETVDPLTGMDDETAGRLVAGLPAEVGEKIVPVLQRLYEVFRDEDATLVEVNPLILTDDGDIIALDAKITLDDNAAFRHDNRDSLSDEAGELDPLERRARDHGLKYVTLDGSVGIIGNGAGLVMSTLDVVGMAGGDPANFLDIGGGASPETMTASLEIVLGDEQVRSVLINVFGGITACDDVARGIVAALEELGDSATKPLVVRLDGNNVEEGRAILADLDHSLVTVVSSMNEAADEAVRKASHVSVS
ncbi:ADP-forming succinate--CoA ligase subunit beta [Corynebacterium suedekumii]|uniref:Succinate--CoA ligase [ADP-forming] subunit beta n=1 Tax=Corynebacterium suedekumii TaxID=3049801 RepID=A0ABY8VMN0_9CORY|nr:ADP-forming succinate--CoA ligase subunit beta [Corynebacterium suedekumii]WIM69908.1 ADP-forming succinate--CoA ligase subunit beta [Corynebacterium suedekumii]